jgi:hypothetical protein
MVNDSPAYVMHAIQKDVYTYPFNFFAQKVRVFIGDQEIGENRFSAEYNARGGAVNITVALAAITDDTVGQYLIIMDAIPFSQEYSLSDVKTERALDALARQIKVLHAMHTLKSPNNEYIDTLAQRIRSLESDHIAMLKREALLLEKLENRIAAIQNDLNNVNATADASLAIAEKLEQNFNKRAGEKRTMRVGELYNIAPDNGRYPRIVLEKLFKEFAEKQEKELADRFESVVMDIAEIYEDIKRIKKTLIKGECKAVKPNPPVLKAHTDENGDVVLTWSDEGADEYKLYLNDGFLGYKTETLTQHIYRDEYNPDRYRFYVTAVNEAGESEPSNVLGIPIFPKPLAAPILDIQADHIIVRSPDYFSITAIVEGVELQSNVITERDAPVNTELEIKYKVCDKTSGIYAVSESIRYTPARDPDWDLSIVQQEDKAVITWREPVVPHNVKIRGVDRIYPDEPDDPDSYRDTNTQPYIADFTKPLHIKAMLSIGLSRVYRVYHATPYIPAPPSFIAVQQLEDGNIFVRWNKAETDKDIYYQVITSWSSPRIQTVIENYITLEPPPPSLRGESLEVSISARWQNLESEKAVKSFVYKPPLAPSNVKVVRENNDLIITWDKKRKHKYIITLLNNDAIWVKRKTKEGSIAINCAEFPIVNRVDVEAVLAGWQSNAAIVYRLPSF